MANAGGSDLTK